MRYPFTTVALVCLGSSLLWLATLGHLSKPRYTSIPDRSTQTIWPGP